jgi:hypothetical protein
MRQLTIVVLVQLLLFASPALGALGSDLDSDNQVKQYGSIFGYSCGAAALLAVVLVGYHMIKGMKAEHTRGKRPSVFREQILDESPKKKKPEVLYLGEKVPEWKIDGRRKATKAALKFLARSDELFSFNRLTEVADEAFRLVKDSLETRSSKQIEKRVTADCLDNLRAEIKKLRAEGRLHIYGKLEVLGVEIVHVEAPAGKKNHTFTALVSAKSKDYFKDAESGEVLRGDKKFYLYQEFWCFRRVKERWLVDRIRSSGDMDRVIEVKNVLTQADLDKFAKNANPEHLREFVAK